MERYKMDSPEQAENKATMVYLQQHVSLATVTNRWQSIQLREEVVSVYQQLLLAAADIATTAGYSAILRHWRTVSVLIFASLAYIYIHIYIVLSRRKIFAPWTNKVGLTKKMVQGVSCQQRHITVFRRPLVHNYITCLWEFLIPHLCSTTTFFRGSCRITKWLCFLKLSGVWKIPQFFIPRARCSI